MPLDFGIIWALKKVVKEKYDAEALATSVLAGTFFTCGWALYNLWAHEDIHGGLHILQRIYVSGAMIKMFWDRYKTINSMAEHL